MLDNAFTQGFISSELVGISFEPTSTFPNTNGELTIGALDDSKYTGDVAYVPVTSTSAETIWREPSTPLSTIG